MKAWLYYVYTNRKHLYALPHVKHLESNVYIWRGDGERIDIVDGVVVGKSGGKWKVQEMNDCIFSCFSKVCVCGLPVVEAE